jgi:hypothetical protein
MENHAQNLRDKTTKKTCDWPRAEYRGGWRCLFPYIQFPLHLSCPSRMSCWKSMATRRKHLYLKTAVYAFISLKILFQDLDINAMCH